MMLSLESCYSVVIPAKAGIHTVYRQGAAGANDHERALRPSRTGTARRGIAWIPAFAGMTREHNGDEGELN
jgi:hypothetical protein